MNASVLVIAHEISTGLVEEKVGKETKGQSNNGLGTLGADQLSIFNLRSTFEQI